MAKRTRLTVNYLSPSQVVAEYTRSLGKGVVVVPSKKKLDPGDVFVLEMTAIGLPEPIEVQSEVAHVAPHPDGTGYLIGMRYSVDKRTSDAVVKLIGRLLQLQKFEKKRKHYRVTVNWPAQLVPDREALKIIDLSYGGMRLCLTGASRLPKNLKKGARLLIALNDYTPSYEGDVIWTAEPPGGVSITPPQLGVQFRKVPPEALEVLERMLRLIDFTPAPDLVSLRVIS